MVVALASVSLLAAGQTAPRIAPRDQLKVSVFGLDGMSGDFLVDTDGNVQVPAARLSQGQRPGRREVEASISEGLVTGGFAIRPPQVTSPCSRRPTGRSQSPAK
jgi:protein involved in polysaccharide export with SLBB domain